MDRNLSSELLDGDEGTSQEIEQSLRDLRFINRWFGGVSATASMVRQVARIRNQSKLSMLEVAGGRGDMPEMARQKLLRDGIDLSVSVADRLPSHLPHDGRPQNGATPGFASVVAADALVLPFRDSSFDLVSCNLFVHHLSPEELVRFVNEGLRVSRSAVLINDLVRSPLHLALVYLSLPLYGSRITHHDAPASVRQAYRPRELAPLLRRTCAASYDFRRYQVYRMGVIAWKH